MFEEIQDRQALIALYHRCFPDAVREEAVVAGILSDPADRPFGVYEGDRLTGACLVHGRAITLLCVDAPYRKQGLGSAMLAEGEKRIREQGFHKLTIGVGTDDRYLMPGVPMHDGADGFFRKRGYHHSWGDTECLDMSQDLADFTYTEHAVGDVIDGRLYRFAGPEDTEAIRDCVSEAQESFVPYYMEAQHYAKGSRTPVLIACEAERVQGALIVSLETEGKGLGSVGCTATRPAAQGQGIATRLVQIGTRFLKDAGMERAFLGYTYTDIVRMYARAGYRISQKYFMAEKEL